MIAEQIQRISSLLNQPLPGEEAQFEMVSYKRPPAHQARKVDPNPRLSAVLALLYPKDNALHTVLMLRPEYEGVHSAQVSFPGGRKEEADASLEITALREAREEVGIVPGDVQLLGQLTEVYIPPSRFLVTPYIGYVNYTPHFIPDAREVQAVIETPLSTLLNEAIVKRKDITLSNGFTLNTPYFDVDGHVVWGATAMMLSEFKAILQQALKA